MLAVCLEAYETRINVKFERLHLRVETIKHKLECSSNLSEEVLHLTFNRKIITSDPKEFEKNEPNEASRVLQLPFLHQNPILGENHF